MHRRDLRRCLLVGVAPVIRSLFLVLSLLVLSGAASASTLTVYWISPQTARYSTAQAACVAKAPTAYAHAVTAQNACYIKQSATDPGYTLAGTVLSSTVTCEFGDNGSQCNSSCDAPKVMESGQCVTPTNQCLAKKDQTAPFIQKYPSFDAYKPSCTGSVDGCAMDTCAGNSQCGTNGETGEFACWGTGKYTGEQQPVADGTALNPPPIPEPTTTDSSQSCTAPAVNSGTTTYTCLTESNANEFASSNCAVGTVNGVQGLHCTKPDYVPESDNKKREDQVTEVTNPDGSKTTTTTSVTTTKHCKAGVCTTTTTTTTTTSGKDANGNQTGTTTTCSGDKCDNPTTPGKDESEESEEEGEDEETTATFSGDEFACGAGTDCASSMEPALRTMFGEDQKILGYADSAQLVMDGFYQSPLATALNGLRWPSSSVCPVYTLSLWGGSFAISEHCAVIADISGFLSAAFMAIWSFAAIRLFMTA